LKPSDDIGANPEYMEGLGREFTLDRREPIYRASQERVLQIIPEA
jgi:hypothetical protein